MCIAFVSEKQARLKTAVEEAKKEIEEYKREREEKFKAQQKEVL